MGTVTVIQFITLDGIVSDPDGSSGTPTGGWAFRHGPETVAGDKFQLGRMMEDGVMLLGRATWQLFAGIWSPRDDPFSRRMNEMHKLVATRSLTDVSAWQNSAVLEGDLLRAVRDQSRTRDVIITGSLSIVHTLLEQDLVDEFRLLVFPSVIGAGHRLFPDGRQLQLRCLSAEPVGTALLTRWGRG